MLKTLREELARCSDFSFSVAFVSADAVAMMKEAFNQFEGRGTIITSDYLGFNSPQALEELRSLERLGIEVRRNTSGEGFHPKAGEPHAEVFALRAAGNKAEGATAYVTLEPCNHYGRTPPCSLALVAAKVSKVFVGMVDPNPLVAGSGIKTLEDGGIEVVVGVEEEACRDLNVDFLKMIAEQEKEKQGN